MRMKRKRFAALAFLTFLPGMAHAQKIPDSFVLAALSPLVVIALAIVLGFLVRSWKTGVTHVGLVILWLLLLVAAARSVENDYIIWTPLALFCVHALIVLALIIGAAWKRIRARSASGGDNR